MQPNRWVLVEALRSRKEGGDWILEDMALIRVCAHAGDAWSEYKALHEAKPDRELCVLSTTWDEPKIEEKLWLGVRAME